MSGFIEYFHSTFSNPVNATGYDHDTDQHLDLNSIIVTEQVLDIVPALCRAGYTSD